MGTHNGNSVLIMNYNYELNIESYHGENSPVLSDVNLHVEVNNKIIIYATAKDNKGFNYKCYMTGWTINSDGALDHYQDRYHFGEVEVY